MVIVLREFSSLPLIASQTDRTQIMLKNRVVLEDLERKLSRRANVEERSAEGKIRSLSQVKCFVVCV
jgi:hypothetical protein